MLLLATHSGRKIEGLRCIVKAVISIDSIPSLSIVAICSSPSARSGYTIVPKRTKVHTPEVLPRTVTLDSQTVELIGTKKKNKSLYLSLPGVIPAKPIKLPDQLRKSALNILEKYPVKDIETQAKQLKNYLWSRHSPVAESELNRQAQAIEHDLVSKKLEKEQINLEPNSLEKSEELEKQMKMIRNKTLNEVRYLNYQWRPLDMNAHLSLIYMYGHLISNYGTLFQIMREIKNIDSNFEPVSMLDFGSGLATSVWAANNLWSMIQEHYCWDSAVDVCTLARLLLQGGSEGDDMCYKGVYFRQQFSKHQEQQVGFDLVVSSHSLIELPGEEERLKVIDKLWRQTEKYMILVENGTLTGHKLIEEARLHVLQKHTADESLRGHVFAPCPHDEPCQRLGDGTKSPCNFELRYVGNWQCKDRTAKHSSNNIIETTRFSYVVLKKGHPDKSIARLPRVVREVIPKSKHVHCKMCFPDTEIRHCVFTKGKHDRSVYDLAKFTKWGNRMPIDNWDSTDDTKSQQDIVSIDETV